MHFNQCTFLGRLTRDPELRSVAGTTLTTGSLAVNRKFRDKAGADREETMFIEWECWGKLADIAGKYCHRGQPLLMSGRLKLDDWQDKANGEKRSRHKLVVENLQFVASAAPRASTDDPVAPPPPPVPAAAPADDIPF